MGDLRSDYDSTFIVQEEEDMIPAALFTKAELQEQRAEVPS
jgi:hypothetical protein